MYKECPKCSQLNPDSNLKCFNCDTSLNSVITTNNDYENSLNIPKDLPSQFVPALIVAFIMLIRSLYILVTLNSLFVFIFMITLIFLLIYIGLSYRKSYIELRDDNILIRYLFSVVNFSINDIKQIRNEKNFIFIEVTNNTYMLRKTILSETNTNKLIFYIKRYNKEIIFNGF